MIKLTFDNYYEGIVDLYTRSDGVHFAIPKDHDTIALLYNTAIFDEYGIDYPTNDWTWEDMYEAAAAITEASGGEVYGTAMDTSNNQDGWYNLIYGYGGAVINEDHTDTLLDSDESKAGMEGEDISGQEINMKQGLLHGRSLTGSCRG